MSDTISDIYNAFPCWLESKDGLVHARRPDAGNSLCRREEYWLSDPPPAASLEDLQNAACPQCLDKGEQILQRPLVRMRYCEDGDWHTVSVSRPEAATPEWLAEQVARAAGKLWINRGGGDLPSNQLWSVCCDGSPERMWFVVDGSAGREFTFEVRQLRIQYTMLAGRLVQNLGEGP